MDAQSYKRIAWHPAGENLAAWAGDDIVIWNVRSREKRLELPHRGVAERLVFSRDGSVLASQSLWDSRVLVWDVGSGQRLLQVSEFDPVACDATGEGGIAFLSKVADQATLTQLETGACRSLSQSLYPPLGWWFGASASPEGRIVAFSSENGLELWNLQTSRRLLAWPIGPCSAQFDRHGRLTLGCTKGVYQLPRHVQGKPSSRSTAVVRLGPPQQLGRAIVPQSLAIDESGEALLVQGIQGWTVIHPGNDSDEVVRLQATGDPRKGAVSNDHRFAAIANWDSGGGSVWDARSGTHLADLAVGKHGVVKFSPDDRWLAATPDGVTVWDTSQWRLVCRIHGARDNPDRPGHCLLARQSRHGRWTNQWQPDIERPGNR